MIDTAQSAHSRSSCSLGRVTAALPAAMLLLRQLLLMLRRLTLGLRSTVSAGIGSCNKRPLRQATSSQVLMLTTTSPHLANYPCSCAQRSRLSNHTSTSAGAAAAAAAHVLHTRAQQLRPWRSGTCCRMKATTVAGRYVSCSGFSDNATADGSADGSAL